MRASATTLQPEVSPSELLLLEDVLKSNSLSGNHLEIGTAAGGTLKALIQAYEGRPRPQFVVVDPFSYFPNQREIVEKNLSASSIDPTSVEFRTGFSWPLLKVAKSRGETFSFIFIDGDHSAKGVMQDLAWTELLEVGGFVCLHDHNASFPGVIWATKRVLSRHKGALSFVAQTESLVVLKLEAELRRAPVTSLDRYLAYVLDVFFFRLRKSIRKRIARIKH